MNWSVVVSNLMTGGFLKGKRTAIIALVVFAGLLGKYLTGDIGLIEFLQQSWEQIALAIGIVTAAASGNVASSTGK